MFPSGKVISRRLTLAAGVESTVSITGAFRRICVKNLTVPDVVWYAISNSGPANAATVGGDNLRSVPNNGDYEDEIESPQLVSMATYSFSLISASAGDVHVVGEEW